ncbi:MAG: hypothetical protein HW412_914 [Bacteroidetes bacterium]|nr:hypothetical protein [Bacteroidota bacterium]
MLKKLVLLVPFMLSVVSSCKDQGDEIIPLSPDAELFRHVSQVDPFTSYRLFPNVDSVTTGTLIGSHAHQPLVRVSMNAIAYSALRNDTLPAGSQFPDGSVVFKQIMMNGQVTLYAVILKDSDHGLSGNGWLWAEFTPDGSPFISVTRRGVNCTGCHALEQGPRHDFVRTFERQH